MSIILSLNGCNDNLATEELSPLPTKCITATSTTPSLHMENNMAKQFLEDADLPIEIYENFEMAIQGDINAREWLDEYDDKNKHKYFSALNGVFPSRNGSNPYSANECYYNIGMLYYKGDDYIPLKQDKNKAFYWLRLSADEGSFFGAIQAGDMALNGDGIPKNEKEAFNLYKKALEIKKHGTAYERLAYCFENGIGTDKDGQKAQEYYFKSTLDGNPIGLYKLSTSDGISQSQSIMLLKAASSMDYSSGYFEMAYGGLDGYSANDSKLRIIERLSEVWDKGTDPVAVQIKKSIRENQYFPKEFTEALIKTSYTYSYHAFAEKNGIKPNRNYEDGRSIRFDLTGDEFESYAVGMAKNYLEYDECTFYELDFDGDGEDEIGIPLHSGAGGAFMVDGFGIFKKNKNGLYEEYAFGPQCSMRDAMRLIKYNSRIYFITNPFSDTDNEPHNITARTIDKNGKGHEVSISCTKYNPKEIITKVYGNYNTDEFSNFLKEIKAQAYEAIAVTKSHRMYNPNTANPVKKTDLPENILSGFLPQDVYFEADIDNDGEKEFIRKAHVITQSKYYNDYNLFQIYDSQSKLCETVEPIMDLLPYDDYFGLHSGGNLYDLLPIGGKVVQFWTQEKDNVTYCVALTRNELLYSLHVYVVKNNQTIPVCHSLLFDEVQDIEVKFVYFFCCE